MCELFGLCCNAKDRASLSLPLFAEFHEPSWHGWGVGYYEDGAGRVVKRVENPNFSRSFMETVRRARSNVVIAHLRLATGGDVCDENCHPFKFSYLGRD